MRYLLYISPPEMKCPKHSVPNGYAANFCKFSDVYVIELLDRFAHRRTKSNFNDRWVVGLPNHFYIRPFRNTSLGLIVLRLQPR